MLPQRQFPTDHAMLETIYTRQLPARGYDVAWVMWTDAPIPPARSEWNGTSVYLLNRHSSLGSRRWIPLFRDIWAKLELSHTVAQSHNVSIIQARNELSSALIALWLRRRLGTRVVFQLSFPAIMAQEGARARRESGLKEGWVIARLTRFLQRFVIRRADLVLAISDTMREWMIKEGAAAHRVVSFPLGFDDSATIGTQDRERARADLGLGGRPVILYFGAMDKVRNLSFLLRVFAILRQVVPDVTLLMLGSSTNRRDWVGLQENAKDLGFSESVRFIERVPRSDVIRFLVASDVTVSPIPPLPEYIPSSPTKVVESLGVGTPVVGNEEIPDQAALIRESGGGECVPYDEQKFAEAIARLLSSKEAARAAGNAGREYVQRRRSYSHLADLIDREYSRLVNRELHGGGVG